MAEEKTQLRADDADETARVAALVARAGLKLPADEIAELVKGYRADREGFERLRTVLEAEGEPAHALAANRGWE